MSKDHLRQSAQDKLPPGWTVIYNGHDFAFTAMSPDFAHTGVVIRSTNHNDLVEKVYRYVMLEPSLSPEQQAHVNEINAYLRQCLDTRTLGDTPNNALTSLREFCITQLGWSREDAEQRIRLDPRRPTVVLFYVPIAPKQLVYDLEIKK